MIVNGNGLTQPGMGIFSKLLSCPSLEGALLTYALYACCCMFFRWLPGGGTGQMGSFCSPDFGGPTSRSTGSGSSVVVYILRITFSAYELVAGGLERGPCGGRRFWRTCYRFNALHPAHFAPLGVAFTALRVLPPRRYTPSDGLIPVQRSVAAARTRR
jgi:hypothetical protein